MTAPVASEAASSFPWRLMMIVLGAAALSAAVMTALIGARREPAVEPPSVVADGTRLQIREGATTWDYLDFAEATLQPGLPPAPVPGRVAVDEARATPVEAPLRGRVETVAVKLGQRLSRGEHLISVRSPELVDLGKEVDQMRSSETAQSKKVERLRSLVALTAEPEKKLIEAERELQELRLARAAAESKRRSLAVDTASEGLYWLTAPRDGVVVARDVLSGEQVGPEREKPLLVIAELDELIVTADVPEGNVRDVRVGQRAVVQPATGVEASVSGAVEYVGEVVDPVRRMVDVRVRVPNQSAALRPNAFVQVAFAPEDQQRVIIPAQAVVTDDQESFVFVRPPGASVVERRQVAVGRQRDGKVEITSGLQPGETYVTQGALLLLNAVDLASQ